MIQAVKATTEKPQMPLSTIISAKLFTDNVHRKKMIPCIARRRNVKGRCPIVISAAFFTACPTVQTKCEMIGKRYRNMLTRNIHTTHKHTRMTANIVVS